MTQSQIRATGRLLQIIDDCLQARGLQRYQREHPVGRPVARRGEL